MVASLHNNLGNLAQAEGDLAGARRHHELALAIRLKRLGADHLDVASTRNNLGNLFLAQGKPAKAREQYLLALARFEASLGRTHEYTSHPLTGLARALLGLGRPAEALPLAERAVTIRAAGAPATDLAESRFALARALWATGNRPRARAVAAEARDGYQAAGAAGSKELATVNAWLRTRAE
jgi:tetratricopeptide (TPR) repeat protein